MYLCWGYPQSIGSDDLPDPVDVLADLDEDIGRV